MFKTITQTDPFAQRILSLLSNLHGWSIEQIDGALIHTNGFRADCTPYWTGDQGDGSYPPHLSFWLLSNGGGTIPISVEIELTLQQGFTFRSLFDGKKVNEGDPFLMAFNRCEAYCTENFMDDISGRFPGTGPSSRGVLPKERGPRPMSCILSIEPPRLFS